jgi:hypothetical protein
MTHHGELKMSTLYYEQFMGETIASETIKLMNEIKKKQPLLQFIPSKTNRSKIYVHDTNPATMVFTHLDVVHASAPENRVGLIGYDGQQYIVSSRLIENGRYSHWSGNEHRSKKSKHMRNIVREAVKFLLPIQFYEVWEDGLGRFERSLVAKTQQIRAAIVNKMRVDPTALFKEFVHMHAQGYVPITQEFKEALAFTAEKQAEIEKYVDYKPTTYMVWVKGNSIEYGVKGSESVAVDSIDKVPEEIRGKMFVLDVSEVNSFIEDVGMKTQEKQYWVIA